MAAKRSILWTVGLALSAAVVCRAQPTPSRGPSPTQLATQEDHQRMMKLLGITSLRQGANGSNPQAPNYANYDESKANPYPNLPDPLVLKNGRKVTTAAMWRNQRRREIMEDFDREIYGRVPKMTPNVNWEVTSTASAAGRVPVIMEFGFTGGFRRAPLGSNRFSPGAGATPSSAPPAFRRTTAQV